MGMIEPELRCPAPRPARLRAGSRQRFVVALALFLILGGAPLLHVCRQIWALQTLQSEGGAVEATVVRRLTSGIPGLPSRALECQFASASGDFRTARLVVDGDWWRASPPGSRVTITACDAVPGLVTLGEPSALQLSAELGIEGYGALLVALLALLCAGSRLRPYFRDLALVSLGTPVAGRVVGKSWRQIHRLGRLVVLPMIHLHFKDPYGVERVRTQIISGDAWADVVEGEAMTVLVCARRRGWFAAYRLLGAEAAPLHREPAVALGPERA